MMMRHWKQVALYLQLYSCEKGVEATVLNIFHMFK